MELTTELEQMLATMKNLNMGFLHLYHHQLSIREEVVDVGTVPLRDLSRFLKLRRILPNLQLDAVHANVKVVIFDVHVIYRRYKETMIHYD